MTPTDQVLARFLRDYPDVVLVLSGEGRLLWANDKAEEFFKQSLVDAMGISVLSYVHPNDLELVLRSFESVQAKHTGNPIEVGANIDGDWHLLETIGAPVAWYEPGAVLFSFRDLTDPQRKEPHCGARPWWILLVVGEPALLPRCDLCCTRVRTTRGG